MSALKKLRTEFTRNYLNAGTILAVIGIEWLYLWLGPWYPAFVRNPHWGHNYAMAAAFLALGLAYFRRSIIVDALAFMAVLAIIPAALELLPHPLTGWTAGALIIIMFCYTLISRKLSAKTALKLNPRLSFWLKKHLPRFSYLILAHISLIYFLVRLPVGTYETDLVTQIFDILLLPFSVMLLLEDMPGIVNVNLVKRIGFFYGMLTITGSLIILFDQPEIYPMLAIDIIITALAIAAVLTDRPEKASDENPPGKSK